MPLMSRWKKIVLIGMCSLVGLYALTGWAWLHDPTWGWWTARRYQQLQQEIRASIPIGTTYQEASSYFAANGISTFRPPGEHVLRGTIARWDTDLFVRWDVWVYVELDSEDQYVTGVDFVRYGHGL
jgi:hypothetical protein